MQCVRSLLYYMYDCYYKVNIYAFYIIKYTRSLIQDTESSIITQLRQYSI